ncbi:hypothetical protein GO013_13630 [Pseudodesulfovibrio sp. JC047]|nr:hypothetical protein [Pseudodesulfovibrio sp. JC047]NDV20451.1 hypothetical protein [Pseudodesulfovibrio sp. JC047]
MVFLLNLDWVPYVFFIEFQYAVRAVAMVFFGVVAVVWYGRLRSAG